MSLRLKALLAVPLVALTVTACTDVDQEAPADSLVLAAFDPVTGIVPLPNDLALRAAPGQSGVTREILFANIAEGGWPGSEVIGVPLRTIVRNPETRAYGPSATPPEGVLPGSINPSTVAIVRVSDDPPTVLEPEFLGYARDTVNPALGILRFRPRGGLPVGRYVVAVRGGQNGIRTADGQTVGADQAIALIAPNKDLRIRENQPLGGLPPALVPALEGLRALYRLGLDWQEVTVDPICRAGVPLPPDAPFPEGRCWLPPLDAQGNLVPTPGIAPAFDAIARVFPHHEAASIQTFEIAAPAVMADTATGQLPFPSDFLLGGDRKVRNIPALGPAAPGLATLDGFSTTGMLLVPLSAPVRADTITRDTVRIYDLGPAAGAPSFDPTRQLQDVASAGTAAQYLTQPPNLVQTVGDVGVSTAIGLQPAVPVPLPGDAGVAYLPPLEPQRRYLVVVTNGVQDLAGRPLVRNTIAKLLLEVQTPLYDASAAEGQRSRIPGVSDADALGLSQLRTLVRAIAPAIETDTRKIAMAYTVTTQTVQQATALLAAIPSAAPAFFTATGGVDLDPTAAPFNVPAERADQFSALTASLGTIEARQPATGALDPGLATWTGEQFLANQRELPLLVTYPSSCTPESRCTAPLVVFLHGLVRGRHALLGVANELAERGFVAAAIDLPFHGDRAVCATNADCSGGGVCTPQTIPNPDPSPGAPPQIPNQLEPAVCAGGEGLTYDPAEFTTTSSGNGFVSSNFFRTRDAIRQSILEHSGLVLALTQPPVEGSLAAALDARGVTVDADRVYFWGHSLGGMVGTSLLATNPRFSRAVLTSAGGTLVDAFVTSPAFRPSVEAVFASIIPGFTFAKVDGTDPAAFDPAIASRFLQTLIVAKWVMDPAEPLNYAADVTADVYGQLVRGDQTVLNQWTALLHANLGIPSTTYVLNEAVPPGERHSYVLFSPDAAPIRADAADFLGNLNQPPPTERTLP